MTFATGLLLGVARAALSASLTLCWRRYSPSAWT